MGVEQRLLAGSSAFERTQTLAHGVERPLAGLPAAFNGAAKIASTPFPQPYTQMGRWLVFWFVFTLPLPLVRAFGAAGGDEVSVAFIPFMVLVAFGFYGLDYCASQLQNPFVAEFGDAQLDGRFMLAVYEDVEMLLQTKDEQLADS